MNILNRPGRLSGIILLAVSALVVAEDYVPPPTGPYQPSVVINRIDRAMPDQNRIYRFPPADLASSPPTLIEDNVSTRREAAAETRPLPEPRQVQAPRTSEPPVYQQQAYPQTGNYPENPQWSYNPYQYGSGWNTNPQPYPYTPGYQQSYPYGYNQYNETSNFFPGMPSPWTENPMQQFFGN